MTQHLTGRAGKAAGHHTVERKCVGIGPECTEYAVYYRIIRDFQGIDRLSAVCCKNADAGFNRSGRGGYRRSVCAGDPSAQKEPRNEIIKIIRKVSAHADAFYYPIVENRKSVLYNCKYSDR